MATVKLDGNANEGYVSLAAIACPYPNLSLASMAWHVGRWFRDTGKTTSCDVRPSRGYKVHGNRMFLDVTNEHDVKRVK